MTSSTPTLRDVAAEAGRLPHDRVERAARQARRHGITRAKVIAAAKRLNYRINLTGQHA